MRVKFFICAVLTLLFQAAITKYVSKYFALSFAITLPLLLLAIYEVIQTKHTIMRNYPLLGRLRYVMEELRPKIYQYFVESDTSGTPINRITRSVVYQRAKNQLSSTPFGTQLDIYEPGYEWVNHSMNPIDYKEIGTHNLRVNVGGKDCKKPYSLSIFNVSAMSFGSLSANAIMSLNWGARVGGFAHNTGEGSISKYHLEHGGDLIWQIGTGYFGARNEDGSFDEVQYEKRSKLPQVKMIELKISQGAKPGHGGILPASKNTKEIAEARGVQPGTRVDSPAKHSAFSGPKELLLFLAKLRKLSGGKPVGFKICFGNPEEFEEICKEVQSSGIAPDFITIDGGEGGTGAAPLEFSNSIGMSLRDGLIFATDLLGKYGLRDQIKILAGGKILTGFDIIKAIALGADACYSARGMMLSLGCIQALECNKNICPAGVATQDKALIHGLVVEDKYKRVASYHRETVLAVAEILGATGLKLTQELKRKHIWRRVSPTVIKSYEDLFPSQDKAS